MPTYQYACTECGHAFDQFQNFSDDALGECPECLGRLRKVFNAVGVVFKGSGFYRNDSRTTTGSSDTASSDTKTETKSDTKTDTKPDKSSTPATKSDTKPASTTSTAPSKA